MAQFRCLIFLSEVVLWRLSHASGDAVFAQAFSKDRVSEVMTAFLAGGPAKTLVLES
jgi:hypothetical protein